MWQCQQTTQPSESMILGRAALTPDGKTLIFSHREAGDEGLTLSHFDLETNKVTRSWTTKEKITAMLQPVRISADGRWVSCGVADGAVQYDLSTGEAELLVAEDSPEIEKDELRVIDTGFAPDGSAMLTANVYGHVGIWYLGSETNMDVRYFDGHDQSSDRTASGTTRTPLRCMAICDDGERIASGDMDGQVLVWRLKDQRILWRCKIHKDPADEMDDKPGAPGTGVEITGLVFSRNGLLAVATSNRGVHIMDTDTGTTLASFVRDRNWSRTPAFSPDGSLLAFTSGTNAYVWNWRSADLQTLEGHQVWDSSFQSMEDKTYRRKQGPPGTMVFTPDGKQLITVDDFNIRRWSQVVR